jgi:hypothetical protein
LEAEKLNFDIDTILYEVSASFNYFRPEDHGDQIRFNLYGLKNWDYIAELNSKSVPYRKGYLSASGLFCYPNEIIGVPERFEFVGIRKQIFADDPQRSVTLPSTGEIVTGDSTSYEVVSRSFIQTLEQLGFHDYRTYPVRVYLMDVWNDLRAPRVGKEPLRAVTLEEAHERFEYTDDEYVILQLTNPAIEIFDESVAVEAYHKKGYAVYQDRKALASNAYEVLPSLYRVNMHETTLFCNQESRLALEKLSLVSCKNFRIMESI